MAVDDDGNSRIDFVWGNMPLQPNTDDNNSARWEVSPYPGDGWSEYITSPDYAYEREVNNYDFFMGGRIHSNQLQAIDSHVIALRHWKHYPEHNSDADAGFALTIGWWEPEQPAYQYPNIIGLPLEEAVKQLVECGVDPAVLVDTQFDAENPYDGIGNDLVNAPGTDYPGVIIWRYMAPNTVIGQHWDGSDWLASESDGMVLDSATYPLEVVAVDNYTEGPVGMFSYWHSFVVLQTTDPDKNSYPWWDN